MEPEYREGPVARNKFAKGMTKLFRVLKSTVLQEKPKPKPKRRKTGKD
jgi:hypothetical protein